VIKPGRITKSPAELRAAMEHLVALRGRLTVKPRSLIRSDDLALVSGGIYALWPPRGRHAF
jgi:hypothetical protein